MEQHGIEIVPIMLSHGGRTFREYYDITPAECCRLLEESDEIPSTAMATPAVFLESYNRAFERGCTHLIGVLINGSGSGTYQAACLCEGMFEEEHGEGAMVIEVFDSRTYTYIYGHIVVKAAEMREQGESFEAITSVIRSRLSRVEAYLGVYTLKYLKKSGRISGGAAFVGEALGLKADQLCLRRRGQGLRQGARRKGARGRHLQKGRRPRAAAGKADRHPALRRCARGASGRGRKAHARGDRLQGRRPLCDRPVRSEQYRPARHRCCVLRRAARVKKIVKNVEYFPVFLVQNAKIL